jgi:hypothetical protein
MIKKKDIKDIISSYFSIADYPILVNSYGRSGSTILTKSIIENANKIKKGPIKKIFSPSISKSAWNLEEAVLKNGLVYKTHDYPPTKGFNTKTRMLYTYSDPIHVVLSLLKLFDERGEEWMKKHYSHLKAPYNNFEKIIEEDSLMLEKHLNSWMQEDRIPIAFIKYESMWNHQEDISNFLGFKINLPPYKERKAINNVDENITEKLEQTYGNLKKRIYKLELFFITNNKN